MRRIGRTAAVLLVALLSAGPAAAATAATPAPAVVTTAAARPAVTVVYGFGDSPLGSWHAEVRPGGISFGTDGTHVIRRLTWRSWQPLAAWGAGRFYIDNCVPDCAGGTDHEYRVTMLLYDVRVHRGRDYFAGLTLEWDQAGTARQETLTWGTHGGTVAFWG